MANDKPPTPAPKDYDEARANAIEERIERLRMQHGWSADTRTIPAAEVEAAAKVGAGPAAAAPPKMTLSYSLAGGPTQVVEVDEEHFDIGTGEKAKLRILHPTVAARHSRISRDGDNFRVRDMNTQTGTFVNERRIPLSAQLADGDKLRCGDIELLVTLKGGPPKQPANPPTAPATRPMAVPSAPPPPPKPLVSEGTVTVSRDALEERIAQLRARVEAGFVAPPPPEPRVEEVYEADEADEAEAVEEAEPVTAPPSACFLVYTDADGTDLEVELVRDRPLIVGRRATADVRIIDNSISGAHASFEWGDDGVVVKDLGSTNGTWIEGERVSIATLLDGGLVRLGIVPVGVRFAYAYGEEVEAVEEQQQQEDAAEEEPASTDFGEEEADAGETPALVPDSGNPLTWHLVWVGENGAVAVLDMDARNACVVAGEGSCEIRVRGRGMKGEHLQFDYTDDGGLEVLQARRDASLKVDDKPVATALLTGGEVIAAAELAIRVVRGPSLAASDHVAGSSKAHRFWAERFKQLAQDLELRFADGKAGLELTLRGDGTASVTRRVGGRTERHQATVETGLQRVLLALLARAGFPDQPAETREGGPELRAQSGGTQSDVVLSDDLVSASSAWREVRELMHAVAAIIV